MSYTDYQNQPSSEKITLAVLHASKRLMGWTLHSGSVYKLENVDVPAIVSLEDSGNAYSEVTEVADVVASSYYYDRGSKVLYLRTTGSDNPNGRFLVLTFKLLFANVPIALPHDLATGYEVFWEPLIQSTSKFGVEIDTINQVSEAIEGSGSLVLRNDQDYWPANFDKITVENKSCSIYSYSRDIDVTEAKLIFRGTVEKRAYDSDTITFSLKDLLSELKNPIPLAYISSLGERNAPEVSLAFQRMIFGRVFGVRPTNIDEVLTGYPVTGTLSVTKDSTVVTGSGTQFIKELSPDDILLIDGVEYTVADALVNTSLNLTEPYAGPTASGLSVTVVPDKPKRWVNRTWKVAGHALREPTATTETGSTVTRLVIDSTEDFFDGDVIYVGTLGSGEIATIESVVNAKVLKLANSLNTIPLAGITITRPAIQNLRLNDVPLVYYRDYTFDAETATLTLRDTAEANASPIRQLTNNLTFVNTSRSIGATGLDGIIEPGDMIGAVGHADFFEVQAVTPTQIYLRDPATFSGTFVGRYKKLILGDNDVLSCDLLGRTVDGTTNGALIRNGPRMVRTLLEDLGLGSIVDTASFNEAEIEAKQDLGLVVPEKFDDMRSHTYREVINTINKSINGGLIQTNAFNLSYFIIKPNKTPSALRLSEPDIFNLAVDTTAQNISKTVVVRYQSREYDYLTGSNSVKVQQKSSDIATHILKTDKIKTIDSKLVNLADAEIYANRWSLLLESSAGLVKFDTKLQGALLEVGDIVDLSHRKLFVRTGGNDKRRLVLVERVMKDGARVSVEAVDLSNTFNRTANVASTPTEFSSSTADEKIYGGYLTDQYGLIDNDPETFGLNIIY